MALTKQQKENLWNDFRQKTESGELVYITPKESKEYRRKFWLSQDKKCPVLNDEIDFKDTSLDHCHKLKSEKLGDEGKGLVRAVLHKEINSFEGKIHNQWKRTSLKNKYKIQDVLKGLIKFYDMIEQGNLPIEQKYIYTSEKPEEPKELFTKPMYNKLKKYYFKIFPNRRKLPRKTKYLNAKIKEYLRLIDEYRRK